MSKQLNDTVEILLVEDNPGDVRLIKECLQQSKFRHTLHVCVDGEDALAYLHKRGDYTDTPRPDLIILDLNLPMLDGRETLALIKKDRDLRSIPVVVLTSSEAAHDVSKIYDLQANAYIVKPTDLEKFAEAMRSIEEFWMKTARLPTK